MFVLGSIFLESCLTVRATSLVVEGTFPASKPNDVVIYVDLNDIPKLYEKVALVSVYRQNGVINKRYWEKLREKCAELGCNGIYKFSTVGNRSTVLVGESYAIPVTTSSDVDEFVAVRYAKK